MKPLVIFISLILFLPFFGVGQNYLTLSGIVSDSLSGQTLEDIDVVVVDQLTGTITSYQGAYILYLDKGSYSIRYSAPGYNKTQIDIDLNDNEVMMVELAPKLLALKNKKKNKRLFDRRNWKGQELLSENN